jgi:hypothetical protein
MKIINVLLTRIAAIVVLALLITATFGIAYETGLLDLVVKVQSWSDRVWDNAVDHVLPRSTISHRSLR